MTSQKQVRNRAIILISLVNALEKNGYSVNLSAFELSRQASELINIVVGIKKSGTTTNIQTLYKVFCHVEFLRRILFRILETLSVTEKGWGDGYGQIVPMNMVKEYYHIRPVDIYFGTPDELKIRGDDLSRDFKACLKELELNDKFDVSEMEKNLQYKVKPSKSLK